jgi:transposase InsO family protein
MYVALKLRFWWPSLKRDIHRYVDACSTCMKARMPVPARKAPLQVFPAASRFELVHLDILGDGSSWQKSPRGNRYILVIIDHFSRYCVAMAVKNQTAETLAEAFFLHWVMQFGCPMRVHTDQGANFESSLFAAELCQRCHIAKSRTMSYHPQSNGACERMNRPLLRLLETSVYECPTDWDLLLPEVTFAYNTTPHRSTQRSPYSVLFGDEARLPCEFLLGSPPDAEPVNEFVANLIRRVANISETARLSANPAQRTRRTTMMRI